MICVSIGRGRHRMMRAEHQHLVEQGAKLVELRVDYINREVSLKRLLDHRPCPVIITCRRESDHGKWSGTEANRQMLLRAAIVEGVDYIDLEDDIAGKIPRYGKTKRIVSLHNFRETPKDLEAIHDRLCQLDPDVVKIATMAHSPADNLRMLNLVQDAKIPTVGICMGEIGMPSRILSARFGAPWTYATFHHERTMAPGQFSYSQMTEIYRYEQINAQTEVYGVIADPVGHSMSPLIHNAAFGHFQMNKVYIPFRVPREDLDSFVISCSRLGIKALSVTIPHKEAIIGHCTQVEDAVEGIGAANTVVFEKGGAAAYNTDYTAAMHSMLEAMGLSAVPNALAGKKAVILGAGGVSRALVYGLTKFGAEVTIASRTHARSEELARRFRAKTVAWDDRCKGQYDLLINGTPIGMHPNVDDTPFDKRALKASQTVFDTVYNPERTLLVKEAREVGCRVVTGLDMFIRQAALQFHHFTGQEAPAELMKESLRRAIGPAKPVTGASS
ncbi:shikimate dehydrogenase [Lignipirellula cremea]|uniref:Multifunctional fusion protein n=1 Tax=Lignipirellula cremea TaxID=2528010 RepID=A0A518DUE7_9BACT|nr:shikimate dehydrogenase [Lignipirellula cremea]QDU95460.1 Shikimate dehydrogenase [Lignipirellula cremea]